MSKRLLLPTLLLISDNPSIRHWIKKHLESQYFVMEAQSRMKAIEAVKTSEIDLIILDSELEEHPPLKLATEIRSFTQNSLTPILLITGKLKKTFREAAFEAGISDFLSSQLDIEELETRVEVANQAKKVREKIAEQSSRIIGKNKD